MRVARPLPDAGRLPDYKLFGSEALNTIRAAAYCWHGMHQDATHPWVVSFARQAVAPYVLKAGNNLRAREYLSAYGIWRAIKQHIAFVMDPHDGRQHVEFLTDSQNLLEMRAGDCDEHVRLAGACLKAIGCPRVQIWICGNGIPEHIFPVLISSFSSRSISVDTTLLDEPFGTVAGLKRGWCYWQFVPKRVADGVHDAARARVRKRSPVFPARTGRLAHC